MVRRAVQITVLVMMVALSGVSSAAAQTTSTTAGVTSPPISFGAWLDDASVMMQGITSVGLSVGRWSGLYGHENDGPVFDLSVGAAKRLQLGVSVPFYHATYTDGSASSGRGDMYLTAKVQILNPDDYGFGFSATPLIEVLSDAELADTTLGLHRLNWALPVSVQIGADKTQVFATTGYFSRGAVFGGIGLTQAVNDQVTVTGSLTVSHSTHDLSATSLATANRTQVNASGGVSIMLNQRVGLWGSVGRTVSTLDQNGASFTGNATVNVLLGTFKK